jgi:hypothetical protein
VRFTAVDRAFLAALLSRLPRHALTPTALARPTRHPAALAP